MRSNRPRSRNASTSAPSGRTSTTTRGIRGSPGAKAAAMTQAAVDALPDSVELVFASPSQSLQFEPITDVDPSAFPQEGGRGPVQRVDQRPRLADPGRPRRHPDRRCPGLGPSRPAVRGRSAGSTRHPPGRHGPRFAGHLVRDQRCPHPRTQSRCVPSRRHPRRGYGHRRRQHRPEGGRPAQRTDPVDPRRVDRDRDHPRHLW